MFIDEMDTRGYNWGSFVGSGPNNTCNGWVDKPASFHNGGDCVSFADGHVEYWRYQDPFTLTIAGSVPGDCALGSLGANSPDLVKMYHMSFGGY